MLLRREAEVVQCQPSSWLVCISSTVHQPRQPVEATHGSARLWCPPVPALGSLLPCASACGRTMKLAYAEYGTEGQGVLPCLSGRAGHSGGGASGGGSGGGASHAEAEATRELCVRAMVAVYSAHAGIIGLRWFAYFAPLWLLLRQELVPNVQQTLLATSVTEHGAGTQPAHALAPLRPTCRFVCSEHA